MVRRAYEADLSALAPAPQTGEALSSWLARVAQAHLLTTSELGREINSSIGALDRGNVEPLSRIGRMTGFKPSLLARHVAADLVAEPLRQTLEPPFCWAVCKTCLAADRDAGEPLFIRSQWLHPLSTACSVHSTALAPYDRTTPPVVDPDVFARVGQGAAQLHEDPLLGAAQFDDRTGWARVNQVLAAADADLEACLALRAAVRDIIDALATQVRLPASGPLIRFFEEMLLPGRKSTRTGIARLPRGLWVDFDATDRLLFVRIALMIIGAPADPAGAEVSPMGRGWLMAEYRHSRFPGWQDVFDEAIEDLMFPLAMLLPREAVVQLGERSRRWPSDLRRRWTYAAAVGAVGGYVS